MDKEDQSLFPETPEELAQLLDYDLRKLKFLLFGLPISRQYIVFTIPKKSGGVREISTPISAIKTIQRRLSEYLNEHYDVKACAYGFVKKRDIVKNACLHRNRRWVVTIDLLDFFPSIIFGRIRGAFLGRPFLCSEEVATLLAQICCFKGVLPQGAPTSPILSNIICRQLDNRLLDFAVRNKLTYSRYADDITFSTNLQAVPKELGQLDEGGAFILNPSFESIVTKCGFTVNQAKTRCSSKYRRQVVTGLTTNEKVNVRRSYVRQIRSMLNAYKKYGLSAAAKEHFTIYSTQTTAYPEHTYRRILIGKIGYLGHVKGKDDPVYRHLVERFKSIDPSVPLTVPILDGEEDIVLFGEGKTDTIHLEAAYNYFVSNGLYQDLKIKFFRYRNDDDVNNDKLYNLCSLRTIQKKNDKLEIYIFDRDVPAFVGKVTSNGRNPKKWGNSVYSMVLPLINHRSFDELCIEHYYRDEDLLKTDDKGRRICLSDEFDKETTKHKHEGLRYRYKNKLQANYPRIIDQDVFNDAGKNVALSKAAFAYYIIQKQPPFDAMDFSAFKSIFDQISEIVKDNQR